MEPTTEPTQEMIEAGYQVLINSGVSEGYLKSDRLLVAEMYRRMVAVAKERTTAELPLPLTANELTVP
jgi:hypothetical protein